MRLYAIGDIHGCDALLADVHERIASDLSARPVADCRIIHIGDYCDRGDDSYGVIERLVRLGSADRRSVFLRGNHDEYLLQFLDDPATGDVYLSANIGGAATLRSYGIGTAHYGIVARSLGAIADELATSLPPSHKAFLRDLRLSARFGDYVFVHAGIRPGIPLEAQDPDDLLWIRSEFLNDRRDHGFVVVHGHTAMEAPEILPNRINIDTGAVFGGALTCLVLEGDGHRLL